MRFFWVIFSLSLFPAMNLDAQKWQAEFAGGISWYNGDLSSGPINFRTAGAGGGVNIKYNTGDMFVFRLGISRFAFGGDDRWHKQEDFVERGLNFKTGVLEASLGVEINLADPAIAYSYPYLFGGVGLFHFNPYSYTNGGKKVYLKPLSTEGQGLTEYPDRKEYSLIQFCLPVGIGWRHQLSDRYELGFEAGVRITFTDYLDDVSTRYIDPGILRTHKGDVAVEMAYRKNRPVEVGGVRGNPGNKDLYFFTGVKFAVDLISKKKDKKKPEPDSGL